MGGAFSLVILFDIDGTLITSEGMGRRAVDRAFCERYGHANVASAVSLAGRTDRELFHQLLVIANVFDKYTPYSHGEIDCAISHYLDCLEADMRSDPKGYLNPGVTQLLERLKAANMGPFGILTGNVERGAEAKLNFFGIRSYFSFGAYGSDAVERSALFPVAAQRLEQLTMRAPIPQNSVLIGDAPSDIRCARDNGARIIAVATGPTPAAELEELEPDFLVEDLSDTDRIFNYIAAIIK